VIPSTRAGWGGCVVSLLPRSREKEFIAYITSAETGYSKYRTLKDDQLKTAVFESVPGTGAGGKCLMWSMRMHGC
jgi:galactokinase